MKRLLDKFQILNFFAREYILLLVAMFFLRMLFFLRSDISVLWTEQISNVTQSFLIGARFDSSIISYLLMICILLFIIALSTFKLSDTLYIYIKYISVITISLIIAFVFFMLIVDIDYYSTFNMHISIKDADYIGSKELMLTIWEEYPVIQNFLLITFMSFLSIYILMKNITTIESNMKKMHIITIVFNLIIVIGMLIIGARGGVGLSNLNWGSAVFCDNELLNQAAMNGVFTLGKSYDLSRKSKKGKRSVFFNNDKTLTPEILKSLYYDDDSEFINDTNILRRITKTGKKANNLNVVIILLESWMAKHIGVIGSDPDLTPNFNKLSKEGILFKNFYATGLRSNKGIVSVLCSYPSQYGKSAMKMINGQKPFYSLSSILKERGYTTSFIYGGDLEFDNMQGFMRINGINNFIGKEDFSDTKLSSKWGAFDEDIFKKTIEYMDTLKQPFFTKIFTLSNHEPFDTPNSFEPKYKGNSKKEKYYNSFLYSDQALGDFFRIAKTKKFYKNTVFLLVADHGRNLHRNVPLDINTFHIPLLIISGKDSLITPSIKNKIGSQTDILPTTMGILGGQYENSAWGKDLLKDNNSNFAFMIKNNNIGFVEDSILLVDHYKLESRIYNIVNDNYIEIKNNNSLRLEMQKKSRCILKFSSEYFSRGVFGK